MPITNVGQKEVLLFGEIFVIMMVFLRKKGPKREGNWQILTSRIKRGKTKKWTK